MKRIIGTVSIVALLIVGGFVLYQKYIVFEESSDDISIIDDTTFQTKDDVEDDTKIKAVEEPRTVVENLTIPWDIVFLPEGGMLVTERGGRLIHIDTNAEESTVSIPSVRARGEGGLLGMALDPNFKENHFLYIYRTSTLNGASINEVVRYRYSNKTVSDELVILGDIKGSLFHNGGRLRFGPPEACAFLQTGCHLYITTGDAQDPSQAQDKGSLSGKILRINTNGTSVEGNPFQSEVYSYGHRNPQGLTWDVLGTLWISEHGPTVSGSGQDEINRIVIGGNYGWPESHGDIVGAGTIAPAVESGSAVTWAPADALYWDGSVFFTGLKGETLYEAVLNEKMSGVVEVREHFKGTYGRLRTLVLGPDDMFYLTTSNRDGRGAVQKGDDKIIRIDPHTFRDVAKQQGL